MDLNIFKCTSLLETKGFYQNGELFIPAEALESYVGLWGGSTVFLNSPLAGKRICVTVLSPSTYVDRLPPVLDRFMSLCTGAGADIIYHDGGVFPSGDLVMAIEPGATHMYVNYLGAPFRSRSLARKIAGNLKRGLKLAYLPDPVAFKNPLYNLKMGLAARLFTPGVVVQWPGNQDDLGIWLFISLMEYFGKGESMDSSLFATSQQTRDIQVSSEDLANSVPHVDPDQAPMTPTLLPEPILDPPSPEPFLDPPIPEISKQSPGKRRAQGRGGKPWKANTSRTSASMSLAQYPDFSHQPGRNTKPITKEPFT